MIDKYKINSYRDYLEKYLIKKFPYSQRQDIEDSVQDTIINAIKTQENWLHNASLKTWLTKIAVNMHFNTFRKSYQKKESTISSDQLLYIFDGKTNDFSEEFCSDVYASQLQDFLFADFKNDLIVKTFISFAYDDLDYSQIAEIENIPIGTVKSRIFKARRKLQKKYELFITKE